MSRAATLVWTAAFYLLLFICLSIVLDSPMPQPSDQKSHVGPVCYGESAIYKTCE